MADAEKLYMQSPLVRWVDTFKANDGHPLEYRDLYDGVFLNDVMQQIDPRLAYDNVNRCVDDVAARLHNWDILVKNIQGFYRDVLQQLLVMRLPNISAICREPGKDSSFGEVRRALLLILGCAVQCEQKEHFIDKIMVLDISAQTDIVENIKEVTDDCKAFLPIQRPQSPTGSTSYQDKILQHLYQLIQERDECAELAADVGQERDYYMSQMEGRPVIDSPQKSPDKHHMALELAECKAKLRHLRQELEDRQEQLLDVKEELEENLAVCSDLKSKNAILVQESRVTRQLRDELDVMKEKAMKADVFEKEILKYKEKLNELEFYKARTEEMKENNSILEETKAMLEDQLANSRKRIETVVEMEFKLESYRQQMEEITMDRDSDRAKIEFLTEENARLEFEKKCSVNESASLETELSVVRSRIGNVGSSLSDQLSETSHTRILRLELENQRLAARLAEMKEASLIHSAEVSLELEKENQRLAKKVEKLQSSLCESSKQLIRIDVELSATKEEKDKLMTAVDNLSEKSDQQVRELEKENEQLSEALHQIRERIEKTSDLKVKDLERDNKRLHETVTTKNSELNKLEFDNRHLQRSYQQLQENTHRVHELEQENQVLEKENVDLHQKVATLQHAADKLDVVEQENSDLSVESHKLQKTVETLQKMAQRREQQEQDHISLTLEHQRLKRTLESLKSESDRAVELESEKNDLNKELQQMRKLLEGQKTQKLKQEQMEIEILNIRNENQRLQKSVELATRQLHQLEEDNMHMEAEKEQIIKELETVKMTAKRLEEKEVEALQLEAEVIQVQKDKAALDKENRKLKQSLGVKDTLLEEVNTKLMSLTQELKSQRQALEKMKETCSRVKDVEKENKELLQELNTDRRTLTTLREDLVNEKIRSQDLGNELDQITNELEKVGLDTAKMTMAEQTKDANRFKALESMIEETLNKSSELKDKKIHTLESRLDESKNRNLKLQDDLQIARTESEIVKQRLEEEFAGKVVTDGRREGNKRDVKLTSSNAAEEIFRLKDHLVELERQNATLMAETGNLHSNNLNVTEHCGKLETQLSNLQCQHSTLQGHYSSLQEQNAKLQVEYTTLQSQVNSTLSQQELLKSQLSCLETEHENLAHKYEGLQNTHQSFVSDHESLQHLHQQLTSEYESLMAEYGSLKSLHKSLKGKLKDLQDEHKILLQGKDDVNKLRDVMERDREQLKRELTSVGNLYTDHQNLKDSHHQLRSAFDKLSKDYSNVLASHKQIKTDYNTQQLRTTELQGELSEARENLTVADMEFQKLENRMETVYQINERIDNENQSLLMQIKQLLNQNHELLMRALSSKDHFAEEEKAYLEKLSELRRQKERLEEKIMDHYKNRILPKKKGLGARIARKARGIMSKGTKRSKSRNNLSEGAEGSSPGFGSPEQLTDISYKLGSKSTEDMSKLANDDSEFLPGLGRPHSNDEGNVTAGQRAATLGSSRNILGQSLQDSELLTLNQFLKETNSTGGSNISDDSGADELRHHGFSQQQLSSDGESRGSDHSNTSNSTAHQQWRNSAAKFRQDVQNLSAPSLASPVARELSISKISHHSTESGSESSCFGSDGVIPSDAFTSNPNTDMKAAQSNHNGYNSSRIGSVGLKSQPSANITSQNITDNYVSGSNLRKVNQEKSSRWVTTNQQPSSLSRNLGSQISAELNQFNPDQHPSSHPSHHSLNNNAVSTREQARDSLQAVTAAKLMSASQSNYSSADCSTPPSAHLSVAPAQLDNCWSSDSRSSATRRDIGRDHNALSGRAFERAKSQGALDRAAEDSTSQVQSSDIMLHDKGLVSSRSQNLDNSVVSGHIPRRSLSHAVPIQTTHQRARPASVIGHQSPHIRGVYSRPHGEERPRQQQRGSSRQSVFTEQKDKMIFSGSIEQEHSTKGPQNESNRPRTAVRSKSVPPQLFNRTDDSDDGDSGKEIPDCRTFRTRNERDGISNHSARQAVDVQDPRETQSFSNISLIKAPSRTRSSSRSSDQSHESDCLGQSYQQHPTSYPQQQGSLVYGKQTPFNRQHNLGQASQTSLAYQDPPHPSQSQALRHHPGSRAGPQPNSVGQVSSSRPDFLPLTHQDQQFRPNHQQSTQNHEPAVAGRTESPSFPRSHSSLGNPSISMPLGFSPGLQDRISTPLGLSPGLQGKISSPLGFSPGLQERMRTPSGHSPCLQERFSSHSEHSPGVQGRIGTPSGHSPGLQERFSSHSEHSPGLQGRIGTPSGHSPGLQERVSSHSEHSPGLQGRIRTPSDHPPGIQGRMSTPSNLSQSPAYGRTSTSSSSISSDPLEGINSSPTGLASGPQNGRTSTSTSGISPGATYSRAIAPSSSLPPGPQNERISTLSSLPPGATYGRTGTPSSRIASDPLHGRSNTPSVFTPGPHNERITTPSVFIPGSHNERITTPSGFTPGPHNERITTPSGFTPGPHNERITTPSGFTPGPHNERITTPSGFTPGPHNERITTPSGFTPGPHNERITTPSGFTPGPHNERITTPSVFTPGPHNERITTPSGFTPGPHNERITTPSGFTPGPHNERITTPSGFTPGPHNERITTPSGFTPGPHNERITTPSGFTPGPHNERITTPSVFTPGPHNERITTPSGFTPGPHNERITTPSGLTPGPQNERITTPSGFTPGPHNERITTPSGFTPGPHNERITTPSGFTPGPHNERITTPSGFTPGPHNERITTPSGFTPGPHNERITTPSGFTPGPQNERITTPSGFTPGPHNERITTPSVLASSPASVPLNWRNNIPSTLPPSPAFGRTSTPLLHPGRQGLPPNQHSRDIQEKASSHPEHARPGEHPGTSSSDYSQSPYSKDRDLRPHQGSVEPRHIPSSHPESYSTSQAQLLNSANNLPSFNPPQPPPRSSSRGPPGNRSLTAVDSTSVPPGQHHLTSQQTTTPHIPPQVRPPIGYHQNNNQPQLQQPGQLNSPDPATSFPVPHPYIPQATPQTKPLPQTPSESEREVDGEQKKTTNSVWRPRWS